MEINVELIEFNKKRLLDYRLILTRVIAKNKIFFSF